MSDNAYCCRATDEGIFIGMSFMKSRWEEQISRMEKGERITAHGKLDRVSSGIVCLEECELSE